MIIQVAKVAISAVAVCIAGSCGRNMLQTNHIKQMNSGEDIQSLLASIDDAEDPVTQIQALKRDETFKLFLSGEVPSDLSELQGDWEGFLLENNGGIMTKVSNLMTNHLFVPGFNRCWAGKQFAGNVGSNRIYDAKKAMYKQKSFFDVSIQDSFVQSGKSSVILKYSKHHSAISLWKTMTDEVRFLPGNKNILIGLGSMAWSGGSANFAPFVLRRNIVQMEAIDSTTKESSLS